MTALSSNPTVYGMGSLRFNPQQVLDDDLRRLARQLSEHPSVSTWLCGPIRLYSRGRKDIRLEYDFQISEDEDLQDAFYRIVHTFVSETLIVYGKWSHSHWIGVEHFS